MEIGTVTRAGQRFDDRNHAPLLLRVIERRAPGRVDSPPMSRMPAPCSTICTPASTAFARIDKHAAVRKRIGCHVDDAHDDRVFAERKRAAAR